MQYLTYLFISDLKTPKIVFLKFKNTSNPHYDTIKLLTKRLHFLLTANRYFVFFSSARRYLSSGSPHVAFHTCAREKKTLSSNSLPEIASHFISCTHLAFNERSHSAAISHSQAIFIDVFNQQMQWLKSLRE